jgi:predicted Zn-dependent protease
MNPHRLAQLKALMAEDRNDPFLPYAIAQEYISGEQWADAEWEFAALIGNFPDYLPAYYHYAIALVKQGKVDGAVVILKRGYELAKVKKDGKTAAEIEALLEDLE